MKKLLLALTGVLMMMTTLLAQAPVDLSVCAGKGYTLTSAADASGTSEVSYQWYEDGKPLADKNEASLTIPAGKAAGTYAYWRMAANDDCPTGVPSNTFIVRVNALPTVTASAVASACAGAAVDFTAAAGGGTTAAMTYTWTIAGATASTTTTTYRRTLSTTGSNTYSVSVRNNNGCVSAASPVGTITINGPAGTNQAVGACSCATGLTACNGYCRNLAADEAACWNNREVRLLCVADDHATGCTVWGGFTRVAYSQADTRAILNQINISAHIMWVNQTEGESCRYACSMTDCYCYATNSLDFGWFGAC
jgi:hypothetical protein